MNLLHKKIALITGGTTGIGAATAKRFQEEGATVIVTGSNTETLEAARHNLPGVEVFASDAGDPRATKVLVSEVVSRHGRIDVLFVNAGIARIVPSAMVEEALFDAHFNVNVRGPYFLIKHAAPSIPDGGSIVLTSSIAAMQGRVGMTVYAATKAALRSFGRSFAAELAPRRIRVNTITPGPIATPIFGKLGLPAEQMGNVAENFRKRVPLKRWGMPEETAAAALFLASDESSFTTGAELLVDGGILELESAQ